MILTPIRRPLAWLNRLGADVIWLAGWFASSQPDTDDGTYCICKLTLDRQPMKVWYRGNEVVRAEVFHGPVQIWEDPPQLAA